MSSTLESLKITSDRPSFFTKKFWNTFIDKLAALIRPYKVYTALLTQSGENAPVATVLENTLGGEIIWSRDDTGSYFGTFPNLFIQNKTHISYRTIDTSNSALINIIWNSVNNIQISTFDSTAIPTLNNYDDLLINTPIEIRVYP